MRALLSRPWTSSLTIPIQAPRDGIEIDEKPGQITSDSLAAESLAENGSFAANQPGVTASSVPSKSTTANTTDTSGASILPSTSDGPSRGYDGGESYVTPGDESRADTSYRSEIGGGGAGAEYSTSRGGPQESYGGTAPSAYSSAGGDEENLKSRPRGMNITEGGFDENAPNASFNNDIGGKNDPGRLAERDFQAANARSGGDAGYPGANVGKETGGGKGGFEVLGDDERA